MRLSLETRVTEDVTVICCKGRIAYGIEAAALSGEIAELAPQTRRVVIDLSGVEMIDAAGLGALISIALTAQASLGQAGCSRQSHPPIAGAYQVDLRFRSSSHLGCRHRRIPWTSGMTDRQWHDGPDSRHDASLRAENDIFFGQTSLIAWLLKAAA